jgi:choline dehydrogenase-like flavoprotein
LNLFDGNAPIGGPFEADSETAGTKRLGAMQQIKLPTRRFKDRDLIDYAIVGVGSAGGVLLQRLARAGFKVVGFEAGPFWDTERQWVSDEAGSRNLYWNDLRITGGQDPLALGSNNSGKGVGGGSVHWASFVPRFHPSDFEIYTQDEVGADWPISYEDIEPYYKLLEREMPVAGLAYYPWGKPHGHPYGPHPMGEVGNVLIKGCPSMGIPVSAGGLVAILSASHGNRTHCIYRGFCIQGCKVGAKASTLVTHVPDAIEHAAEIRDNSMVARVSIAKDGRTDGIVYFDAEGNEHFQRARAVIVCGYALETPRLLFNSSCPGHEQGLANSSGTLGKYLMAQAGNVILGKFDELIRPLVLDGESQDSALNLHLPGDQTERLTWRSIIQT